MVKKIFVGITTIALPFLLSAQTYKIAEPDMLDEIMSRKDMLEQNLKKQMVQEKEHIQNLTGESLTKAPKTYSYYVDPTYTLKQDIPRVDNQGRQVGILYPKGYTFNPIEYLPMLPPPIVVIDACDQKELDFATKYISTSPNAMIASSGCALKKFPKNFNRHLFLVSHEMKEKFNLKYTVSVVSIDKAAKRIKVDVYKTTR